MSPTFSPAELDWFEALLDQPDHDLYGWIVGTAADAGRVRRRYHEPDQARSGSKFTRRAGDDRGG